MNRIPIFGSLLLATLLYGDADFDLLRFSYIGDTAKITQSLKAKPHLEVRDEDEMTPLLLAAYENRIDALKLLIDKGADINATSFSGRNALSYAVQNTNPEMVKLLLYKGSVLILDGSERDILYSGVVGKNSEVLRLILPYEKNLNRTYLKNSDQKDARNLVKTTLLIQAVNSGSLENVKLLIEKSADINQANDRGETPILTALREKEFEIATYLSDHGAKLDVRDAMGNTVLSYALNLRQSALALRALEVSDLSLWFSRDCVRAKDWVLNEEEDILADKSDELEWNYLHIAALNNQSEVIKVLLSKGMKIEEPNRGEIEKLPALAWAIKRGNYEAFKMLLDAGADPYELYKGPGQGDMGLMYVAGGGSSYTPLSYAMSGDSENPKIIETLLALPHFKRYAQSETHAFYKFMLILATDEGGKRQKDAKEIIERFKKEGFRPSGSDIELEQSASQKQEPKPSETKSVYTLISEALRAGDIDAIKKLKASGVDVVKGYEDAPKMAIVEHHPEMVLPLIDLGYNVNMEDSDGDGILHTIVTYTDDPANREIFLELIKRGDRLNHANHQGETPLMKLAHWDKKYPEFREQLIQKGANLGNDPKAIERLYTLENYKELTSLVNDSRLHSNLKKLYRDSNLTHVAIQSIKNKRTPQAITIHLFDAAYRLGLPIDYHQVIEKAQKEGSEGIVKAAHYYGGFEPAPQSTQERYAKYVDVGMIDSALEYYLKHAKELNAVEGLHDWSKAPLTIAIDHQKKSFYERIIKAGAWIDDDDHDNGDRLIAQNDSESIKLFVNLGMNLNHIGRYNNSYFFRSVYHSHKNTSIAKELLRLGYNPMNPNLSSKRNIEDLSLAYTVAMEKGDNELAAIAKKLLDQHNGVIDADDSQVVLKEGKVYLKGSNKPFNGTLKGGYGEYEKKTQYVNGLKEGQLKVIKPGGDVFAIATFLKGIMVYGAVSHNNNNKIEVTMCWFDDYGILKSCEEHSADKRPFTPKLSRERVREILGEL